MDLCSRCGNTKSSPLSECVTCAALEAARVGFPSPPKHCPKCKAEVPGPSALGKLTCPACRLVFPDYEAWVVQCRADAYAAHPAPATSSAFHPGPPPPGLRAVAYSLLVAAPVQAFEGALLPDLLLPCLALAALQVAAGIALLRGVPRADRLALLAAGLSAPLSIFILPAAYFAWLAWYFTRPAATSHFGPATDPASPRARQASLGVLLAVAAAGVAAHSAFVHPALETAFSWNDPLPPALAAAHFSGRHAPWIAAGFLGLLVVIDLLGSIHRGGHRRASIAAAAALVLLGLFPATAALQYAQAARRAGELAMESDITRLLWALKEPDPKRRIGAARRLGRLGLDARTAVAALERALGDPDPRVRFAAAAAMSTIRPEDDRAASILGGVFSDPAAPAADRELALRALIPFGPRARPVLPALIADLARDGAALPLIVEIGPAAVPGVVDLLRHPDAALRRRALEILRRLGLSARSAAPALESALRDVDPETRAEAARALGEVQREKALAILHEQLKENPGAADALCALGERDGLSGSTRPGNHLNALRRPAQWDHLRRLTIDVDLDGPGGRILEDLAVQAVMCVEASPAVQRDLAAVHRFYGSSRKRSALDVLTALDVAFVLEEDRIRILSSGQAAEFWTPWLFEARAGRP